MGPLRECELEAFVVKTRELAERKSVPLLVWHYRDHPEGTFMRRVQHDDTVKRPWVSYVGTGENNISAHMAYERLLTAENVVKRNRSETSRNNIGSILDEVETTLEEERE